MTTKSKSTGRKKLKGAPLKKVKSLTVRGTPWRE